MSCFECGQPAECQHHVVPKCLGGTKTVPLCLVCHGKVHERDFVRHRRLQLTGIQKAKENGIYLGRKKGTTKKTPALAKEMRDQGHAVSSIAQELGVSERTVFRYLRPALTDDLVFSTST